MAHNISITTGNGDGMKKKIETIPDNPRPIFIKMKSILDIVNCLID